MRTTRHASRAASVARGGFALLAVLWIIVAAVSFGLTITLAARESVATARNRMSGTRAAWRAHDCLERARVVIGEALEGADDPGPSSASPWLELDSVVARSFVVDGTPCHVQLRAVSTTLDANTADEEMLRSMFRAVDIAPARADSMTDALLDWRDADDVARPLGAERAWYVAARRATPRNAPLASAREIALVRGFAETGSVLDTILGVEPGRVFLARAALPVVAGLPGMGDEAVSRIAERRARGAPGLELLAFAGELSVEARTTMVSHYAELARLTTPEPDAWIVTSVARDDGSPVTAGMEIRLVRAGTRAAVVRRRSWIE